MVKRVPVRPLIATLVAIYCYSLGSPVCQAEGESAPDFGRDIRPILSDKCFACHGPDAEHRQGGYRLDQRDSSTAEADSGELPIVPGDTEASEILKRIVDPNESIRMPPPETHKRVTPEEVELLRKWIAAGADYQQHWSLVPPKRPDVPTVNQTDWPRGPVDRFVLRRIEREGLSPKPEAKRQRLLRRVTLDLTGLPPTLAEMQAFEADASPGAYERLVDRLLASSAYGEHMARFWLDAARYGDTHGLHLDNYREMWLYRDWAVNAFNRNMPYDQFIVEQLAGDLLTNPTDEQLVATGFNRCHVTTSEGGSIKEEVLARNVFDRVDTFSTVFLGLTVGCSRCHDHKYDPITQKDYYSLYAFFNSLDASPLDGNAKAHAPVLQQPSHDQQVRLAFLDSRIPDLANKLQGDWPEVDAAQTVWEQTVRDDKQDERRVKLSEWHSLGAFTDDGNNDFDRAYISETQSIDLKKIYTTGFGGQLRWTKQPKWEDGKVNQGVPTRGNFVSVAYLHRKIHSDRDRILRVSLGSDDAIKVFLNGKQLLANDVRRGAAADQELLDLPLKQGENELLLKIVNYLGKSAFYFGLPGDAGAAPKEILSIVKLDATKRTKEQSKKLRDHFRTNVCDIGDLVVVREEHAELLAERKAVKDKIPTTLVWKETKEPRQAHLLNRGEYDQPGEVVERDTLASLPPMAAELPRNRLGLALWLIAPEQPLTSRVVVNRFWQQLFGMGLVRTADDFGSQGEPPSHPELLDWLATDFTANGWDVKRLMKQLVMSATYRQSSSASPNEYRSDPDNRLLARGPRLRLDAEMLRDQALAVSGLLVEKLGGPGVKPPQPDGLWFAVGYSGSNTARFKPDKEHEKIHRRTLYTFVKRTAVAPQMSTFDAPSREACIVNRERTNTPLQALLVLNDPQYVEAARSLAQRTMREAEGGPAERIEYMFRLCTARQPTSAEVERLVKGYEVDLAAFQANPSAAKALAANTESEDLPKLAAWTLTANVLLNLDEVITRN